MRASFDYADASVLVTGASTGIGYEIARQFGSCGANVAICGRNADRLASAARALRASGVNAMTKMADVRDWSQVSRLVDQVVAEYGGVDILINNAGGHFASPLESISPNGWSAVVDLNLTGTFLCSKAVFPVFHEQGSGTVVNIGSIAAFGAHPQRAHAGAAKAGVSSLTMTMAYEWAAYDIRVNCVAPGAIMTDSSPSVADPEHRSTVESRMPLGRAGLPEEVARACLFLASDSASYVTGETLRVDGGPRRAI